MSKKRLLLNSDLLNITVKRLCKEIIENHDNLENTVLLGLQPRGVFLAQRIKLELEAILGVDINIGELDATFYRDDFRRRDSILKPNTTNIPFLIEGKCVILIDDVMATGRMVRAALDAMQAFGRPQKVELLCLINRSYNRELPVQPDYIGRNVNTLDTQKVLVEWTENGSKKDNSWIIG